MPGPCQPLDPVGPVRTIHESLYGGRLTGQQYTDGWIFEIESPIGMAPAPEELPKDVADLLVALPRAVVMSAWAGRSRLRLGFWVPTRVFERYFPKGLPRPAARAETIAGPTPLAG